MDRTHTETIKLVKSSLAENQVFDQLLEQLISQAERDLLNQCDAELVESQYIARLSERKNTLVNLRRMIYER